MAYRGTSDYAVIAMAGFAGDGKYIPILQSVRASSKEEAVEIVKSYQRVKYDQKYAIIACDKCSFHESYLIGLINDKDPFLTESNNTNADERAVDKRIDVERLVKLYRKNSNDRLRNKLDRIRTKDFFGEPYLVLQRFCAPERDGDDGFNYGKQLDVHSMLEEYFTYFVKEHAMSPMPIMKDKSSYNKEKTIRTRMLILYSILFGENNPLGIVCDGKTLTYTDNNGTNQTINLPQGPITREDNKYVYKIKQIVADVGKVEPLYSTRQRYSY